MISPVAYSAQKNKYEEKKSEKSAADQDLTFFEGIRRGARGLDNTETAFARTPAGPREVTETQTYKQQTDSVVISNAKRIDPFHCVDFEKKTKVSNNGSNKG